MLRHFRFFADLKVVEDWFLSNLCGSVGGCNHWRVKKSGGDGAFEAFLAMAWSNQSTQYLCYYLCNQQDCLPPYVQIPSG